MIFVSACTTNSGLPKAEVSALLNSGEFTFMAQRANPTNYDVINVMNSLPGSSSARMLDLDYGYTVQLKKSEIEVTLPYFGRMYTPSYDTSKNSYRFTSKDFTVSERPGKKSSVVYSIVTHDQPNVRRIVMEVFSNGKSFVTIDSNDRQIISYDGYIMKNAVPKE